MKLLGYLFFLNAVIFLLLDFNILEIEFINNLTLDNWKSTICLVSIVIGIALFKIAKIKKPLK